MNTQTSCHGYDNPSRCSPKRRTNHLGHEGRLERGVLRGYELESYVECGLCFPFLCDVA